MLQDRDAAGKQKPKNRYTCPNQEDFFTILSGPGAFVICCRVSTRQQRSHLKDQEDSLVAKILQLGGKVVQVFQHVGSGVDPSWLYRARNCAIANGAKLLAESPDRYIRSPLYHSSLNPHATPRQIELDELLLYTQGVELVVVSKQATRSQQICRGKEKTVPKKLKRKELMPQAKLLRKQGKSLRAIAKQLGVAHSTVQGWVR